MQRHDVWKFFFGGNMQRRSERIKRTPDAASVPEVHPSGKVVSTVVKRDESSEAWRGGGGERERAEWTLESGQRRTFIVLFVGVRIAAHIFNHPCYHIAYLAIVVTEKHKLYHPPPAGWSRKGYTRIHTTGKEHSMMEICNIGIWKGPTIFVFNF